MRDHVSELGRRISGLTMPPLTPEELTASLARRDRPRQPVTTRDTALIGAIGQELAGRDQRIEALERRIEKLEQRGWKGDYQRALAYPMQSEVRHKHSTWIATRDIAPGEVPGEGATGWQQKIKSEVTPRQPTQERSYGR
jgi:hypothetical protein